MMLFCITNTLKKLKVLPQDVTLLLSEFLLFTFRQKGLVLHQRRQHKIDLRLLDCCRKFLVSQIFSFSEVRRKIFRKSGPW